MWERGEGAEALKWLRRAASTAADRDADVRAVELFKAAADMASLVDAEEAADVGRPPPRTRVAGEADPPTEPRAPRDLVPPVPPETSVSERFRALGFTDGEEDTFIRPETMLRRALMAIDPSFAERTDYHYDGVGEPPQEFPVPPRPPSDEDDRGEDTPKRITSAPKSPARKVISSWGEGEDSISIVSLDGDEVDEVDDGEFNEDDEPTDPNNKTLKREPAQAESARAVAKAGPMPGGLLTLRVAVLPIPEEGDIRLIFLSPGEDPPPGIATALLVPPSQEDAELLAKLYADSEAKL